MADTPTVQFVPSLVYPFDDLYLYSDSNRTLQTTIKKWQSRVTNVGLIWAPSRVITFLSVGRHRHYPSGNLFRFVKQPPAGVSRQSIIINQLRGHRWHVHQSQANASAPPPSVTSPVTLVDRSSISRLFPVGPTPTPLRPCRLFKRESRLHGQRFNESLFEESRTSGAEASGVSAFE